MRRITALSIGLGLMAASGVVTAAPASATVCTPTIISASASNAVITETGQAASRVTVRAADSCSTWSQPGVWGVTVNAYNPGRDVASAWLDRSSGTATDGTWTGFLTFTSKDALGTWYVDVTASDSDGSVSSVREASMTLRRNTRVSADARPEPVDRNGTLRVQGRVTKLTTKLEYVAYRDAVVRVYFKRAGTTTKVLKGKTRTDSRGRYAMSFTARRSGTWYAYLPGSFANSSRWSTGDLVRIG